MHSPSVSTLQGGQPNNSDLQITGASSIMLTEDIADRVFQDESPICYDKYVGDNQLQMDANNSF